jgi:hypothetical protein
MTKKYIDDLTYQVIGAAIEVHKNLGFIGKCVSQRTYVNEYYRILPEC